MNAAAAVMQLDATSCRTEALNRTKGFLGVSSETVEAMDQDIVARYRSMSNEELLPIGEKALQDIADDIIALDEIRNRFRKGAILGYQNWKEFVAKNSKYSMRTVQRRLTEVNGRDETKVNDRYKHPVAAIVKPVPVAAPVTTKTFKNPAIDQLAKLRKQFPAVQIERAGGSCMTAFQVWIDTEANNSPKGKTTEIVTVELTTDQLRTVKGKFRVGANGLEYKGVQTFLKAWGVK